MRVRCRTPSTSCSLSSYFDGAPIPRQLEEGVASAGGGARGGTPPGPSHEKGFTAQTALQQDRSHTHTHTRRHTHADTQGSWPFSKRRALERRVRAQSGSRVTSDAHAEADRQADTCCVRGGRGASSDGGGKMESRLPHPKKCQWGVHVVSVVFPSPITTTKGEWGDERGC